MTRFTLFIVMLMMTVQVGAQTLRVLNGSNSQPISDVFIYSRNQSQLTNTVGEADLSTFDSGATLQFQHPAFITQSATMQQLREQDFSISLTPQQIELNAVVISANRWEQNRREVPNKITPIDIQSLPLQNPQTAADMLSNTGQVYVQKSQMGGGSPMIRGFAANRVLMVIDGVRMNNAIYRSGNLQNIIAIDPNSLESAEVIFGPGSILYGSDALGGVMDFHTKKPRFNAEKTSIKVGAMARYASANNESTQHINIMAGGKKLASYTAFTYSRFDDLHMGSQGPDEYLRPWFVKVKDTTDLVITNANDEIQQQTAYNQWNLLQKLRYRPNNNFELGYTFLYTNSSNIPRYDRLIESKKGAPKYAEWYYGPQKWMMQALNLNFLKGNRLYDEGKITLAMQQMEESRHDRKLGNHEKRSRTETVDIWSLNADFNKRLFTNARLFYGIEALHNQVGSSGYSLNRVTRQKKTVSSRYPGGGTSYYSAAAYTTLKYTFNPVWTWQGGLRYSYNGMRSEFTDNIYSFPFKTLTINNDALTGSMGLVCRATESLQINANLSSGYRTPNVDDAAKIFDSEPGNVIVPNENIEPEYAYNADLGMILTFGRGGKAELTAFYTLLDNAMVRRDFLFNGKDSIMYDGLNSKVQAIVNEGQSTIYGMSMALRIPITTWMAFENHLTWTDGEEDDGSPLRHASPLFGRTSLHMQHKKFQGTLYADYNGEITYHNLAATERDKGYMYATDQNGNPWSPGWYTINCKATYQLPANLSISAGVENILNKRYRPYSSGIVAPGRNFIISLRATL